LAVVILITILAIGLLLPSVQKASDGGGNRTKCINNLRQIGLATQQVNDVQGRLPPLFGEFAGKPAASFWYHILPYIEEKAVYERLPPKFMVQTSPILIPVDLTDPATSLLGNAAAARVPTYICPSDDNAPPEGVYPIASASRFGPDVTISAVTTDGKAYGAAATFPAGYQLVFGTGSYAANYLVFGALEAPRIPESMPDGTSTTMLFTEKTPLCGQTGGNLWAFPYLGTDQAGTAQGFFPFTSTSPWYDWSGVFGYYPPNQRNPLNVPTVNDLYYALEPIPFGRYPLFMHQPTQDACDPTLPTSFHPSGIIVAMGDASARVVNARVTPQTWQAAITPSPIPGVTYLPGTSPRSDVLRSDWN
jgi:hypothetical protein